MGFFRNLFRSDTPSGTDVLADLLDRAADDPNARITFYQSLPDSTLWVPGEISDGEVLLKPYDVEGRKTLLVFSSAQELERVLRDKPEYISLNARALLTAALTIGCESVVLNYGTRSQKEFTPSEIIAVLDGSILSSQGADSMVMLGQPREAPIALLDQLRLKLPPRTEVRAAYLAQVTAVDRNSEPVSDPSIIIAFESDMSDEDMEALCTNAQRIAAALDVVDISFTRLNDDGIGRYMRSETTPFYVAEDR